MADAKRREDAQKVLTEKMRTVPSGDISAELDPTTGTVRIAQRHSLKIEHDIVAMDLLTFRELAAQMLMGEVSLTKQALAHQASLANTSKKGGPS